MYKSISIYLKFTKLSLLPYARSHIIFVTCDKYLLKIKVSYCNYIPINHKLWKGNYDNPHSISQPHGQGCGYTNYIDSLSTLTQI